MGFDCGFDVYPRLSPDPAVKEKYQRFLAEVIRTYGDAHDKKGRRADGKVLQIPGSADSDDKLNIRFMVGECPRIPYSPDHCAYFLRFSSKVSGHLTTPAEPYIRGVCNIAENHFGSRIHFWHELRETEDERQRGYYDWNEVHAANDQMKGLREQQVTDPQVDVLDQVQGLGSLAISAPTNFADSLPSFEDLPDENGIDLRYFETFDGFHYTPRKHWCFLAEIAWMDQFLRVRLWVRDARAREVPISFYTEGRGTEIPAHLLQVGNTVAVLYAEQHGFLDLSLGIRLETINAFQIFPVSLERIFKLIEEKDNKDPACGQCGATSQNLAKCARCKITRYCNKECQTIAWKEKHKVDCKLLRSKNFRMLLHLNDEEPEGFHKFTSMA